jgi:hypothetical protein
MLVGVVTLNALSVSRRIREGRPARPLVMQVGDFMGSRLPVERGACKSEHSRGCPVFTRMRGGSAHPCWWSLNSIFWGGFREWIPRGFALFNHWFWVPLIQVPDSGGPPAR